MILTYHHIDLYINKELVELESQESLNLRINDVLFNPTKTNTTQATYSFSFDIPSTPKNDVILGYANNLAKTNKFHTRYQAEVYADGVNVFTGSLTVDKYNYRDKAYECNLVNIKINSLEDIFGESTLNEVPWYVPFNGASTINQINADMSTKYYFPLVSYGCFQKNPVYTDEVGSDFTSKFEIDEYNKWWITSFYPSLNCMEYIKKAFEWKGYNVGGSAFSDPQINSIYASCNLADEQVPVYNLGHEKLGTLSLSCNWSNGNNVDDKYTNYLDFELNYPFIPAGVKSNKQIQQGGYFPEVTESKIDRFDVEHCDFSSIDIYNVFDSANTQSTTTINDGTYLFDPNDRIIVIPADGFYRIDLKVTAQLKQGDGAIKADHWIINYNDDGGEIQTITEPLSFRRTSPFEVQLVKNFSTDDGCELIYGKNKEVRYADYRQQVLRPQTLYEQTVTCYPHEAPHWCDVPTKEGDLTMKTARAASKKYYQTTEGDMPPGRWSHSYNGWRSLGNTYEAGWSMAFDPVVNDNFICGVSTLSNGVTAVRKNGYSWSKLYEERNDVFYNTLAYENIKYKLMSNGERKYETGVTTSFNKNSYINAPSDYVNVSDNTFTSRVCCCVKLKRNDKLELMAILRHYDSSFDDGQVNYYVSANIDLDIKAMSDWSYYNLKAKPLTYEMDPTFPVDLHLNNFVNKEKKISEWVNNFTKAFNLKITQTGNDIEIDTNKGLKKTVDYAVDIDDKVVADSVESQYISYPREMYVKYNINTSEWGFERTVPEEHINDEDWENWGDSGYTVIKLNDDSYETSTQNTSVQFSYTYYDNFTWHNPDNLSTTSIISIPVIEDSQYMADGYGYEEAMEHDGYSKTQRFWYRQSPSSEYVYTSDMFHDRINLSYPVNYYNNFNLSYKNTETSILTEYYNCTPLLASNFVNVSTYLTPMEYKAIKGGACIHFNDDIYYVSEINGYSPDGHNETELKLLKKV